jgi:hypothetical protein
MAVGAAALNTVPTPGAASQARQVGFGPRLVQKYQFGGI